MVCASRKVNYSPQFVLGGSTKQISSTHKGTRCFFSHFALSLFHTFTVSVSARGGCYKV